MKRVILDTNIYGRMLDDVQDVEAVQNSGNVIIYGFEIIRKELRKLSKNVHHQNRQLRILLLGIYDASVKSHDYQVTEHMKELAKEYYKVYNELEGMRSSDEIMNDMLIVACGSIHELDIVVSEDRKTMSSEKCIKAYRIVNGLRKYKTPDFIGYDKFKMLISL